MSSSDSCSVAANLAKHASSVTAGSAERGAGATSGSDPGAFTSPDNTWRAEESFKRCVFTVSVAFLRFYIVSVVFLGLHIVPVVFLRL